MKQLMMTVSVLALAGIAVSCANRPAPNNADAKEWTPEIQKAYPDWQPPEKMPKGNADYNAQFGNDGKKPATIQPAVDLKPVPETKPVAEETKPAETQPVVDVKPVAEEKADVPEVKPVTFARVDIENEGKLFLLNGYEKTEAELEIYLKEAVAQAPDFGLIILFEESSRASMATFAEKAKTFGIKKINAMTRKDLLNAQLDAVAAKNGNKPLPGAVTEGEDAKPAPVKMKYVVDSTQEPVQYKVQEGDSLSIIAKKQYHDGALWPILLDANKEMLNGNPNKLRIGKTLNIPVLKQVPAESK